MKENVSGGFFLNTVYCRRRPGGTNRVDRALIVDHSITRPFVPGKRKIYILKRQIIFKDSVRGGWISCYSM